VEAGADAAGAGVGAAVTGATTGAAVTAGDGTRFAAGTGGVPAAAVRSGEGEGRADPRTGLAATGGGVNVVDGRDATVEGTGDAAGVASRPTGDGKGAADGGGRAGGSMGCRKR
jgi:hypothetical protein